MWKRDPFLWFALAGGALALVLWPYLPYGKETIRVDARTVDELVERRTNAAGRELTEAEREEAVHDYVREELLIREAYRNGSHLENLQVRKRLLLAMRTAMAEDVPEPSEAQLRAYYRSHAARYRMPASTSFSHVFFEVAPADVAGVLARLESGEAWETIGDPFPLGSTLVRQTRARIERELGFELAEAVDAFPAGVWRGPVASKRGVHFVRVEGRRAAVLPEVESVLPYVRVDWLTERRLEIRKRHMARIRERYTIVSPEP